MSRDRDEMTEAELAEWQYAHRAELDAEEGEPVEVSFSPELSVTMSFRLPGPEADAVREAARAADMSLSEWIRQTLATAVANPPADAASRERELEAEVADAERQLETATDALRNIKRRVRAARNSQRDHEAGKAASTKSTKKSGSKTTAKKATSTSKAGKKAAGKKAARKRTSKKRSGG